MGLVTTTEDHDLEEARKLVDPSESICPGCKQSITLTGETLTTFNPAIGLEGHQCPHCGQTISKRKPGFGRL